MKPVCLFTAAVAVCMTQNLYSQPATILEKKFPATFRITHALTIKKNTPDLSRAVNPQFMAALALPGSNEYQVVRNLAVSAGEILEYEGRKERYVRYRGKEPLKRLVVSYDITTYKLFPRWDLLKSIHPYDVSRPDYVRYTKRDDGRIQADHPIIRKAADRIREESKDSVEFVKKAYLWEQKTLKWKNTAGTLDEIFANGGGECGSLSTVLISLLRNNGIPARFMTGYVIRNGKGDSHAWSEFYLERYGWIPIDPAFYGGMENDPLYMGFYDGRRLFLTRGDDYTIHDGTNPLYAGSFSFSHRYSWGGGTVSGVYEYDIDTVCETLEDGSAAEAGYYAAPDFMESVQRKALALINDRRKHGDLPAFQFSAELNAVSAAYLFPFKGNGPLEKSGIKYTRFGRWNYFYGFPTLTPVEKFIAFFPWKELENPEYNRLGIGYRYVEGIHQFYFVLLTVRD